MMNASFCTGKNYRNLLLRAVDWFYIFSGMKRGNKPQKPPFHTRIICTLWSMCVACGPLQMQKYSYRLLCQNVSKGYVQMSHASVIAPDTFKSHNQYILYIFLFIFSSSLHSAASDHTFIHVFLCLFQFLKPPFCIGITCYSFTFYLVLQRRLQYFYSVAVSKIWCQLPWKSIVLSMGG